MILNQKMEILKILEESVPVDSLYNSDASKSVIMKEDKEALVDQKLLSLKNSLGDLFKAKVDEYDLIPKLNDLDFIISNNLCTTRDVSDRFYVKEVFESNLVEQKVLFYEFLNDENEKNKILLEEANGDLDRLKAEIEFLQKQNRACENEIDRLTNTILDILEH